MTSLEKISEQLDSNDNRWVKLDFSTTQWMAIIAEHFGELAAIVTEDQAFHGHESDLREEMEHGLVCLGAAVLGWLNSFPATGASDE